MTTIRLKERCTDCGGRGVYIAGDWMGRCWLCQGKGWHYGTMTKPMNVPKGYDKVPVPTYDASGKRIR